MKYIILLIFVFTSSLAYGQRDLFIGEYEKPGKYAGDTAKSIFLSIDSVKEINMTVIKNGTDYWVRAKSGTWEIMKRGVYGHYYITLQYNDGSKENIVFNPSYNSRPRNDSTPPDNYEIDINGVAGFSIQGKNGSKDVIQKHYRSIKAGS